MSAAELNYMLKIVTGLQSLVSRETDPTDAAVLSVTTFHAGKTQNVIPETAELSGTVRAFREDSRERIKASLARVCRAVADQSGAQVTVDYERGYPATVNDKTETEECRRRLLP